MDELLRGKARRVDPAALHERHSLLDPQKRLLRIELREEESGPAGIAGASSEQLREGGPRRRRHVPALAGPAGETIKLGRPDLRADSSAGDQRQASCHTTHNVLVLL